MEDIKIDDLGKNMLSLELIGPQATSFLISILGKEFEEMKENEIREFEYNENIISVTCLETIDDEPVYRVLVDSENSAHILENLLKDKGVFEVGLIGEDAYDIFRIKNGISVVPNELNDAFNPHELKLLEDVSFTKGCYIGQEVIARLDTYQKVQKYLCGVFIESEETSVQENSDLVDDDGMIIGRLTSIVDSNELFDRKFGLAVVRKQFTEKGTRLRIGEKGNSYAIVTDIPIRA